jgi:CubicO group peptidase (beta-lactamase class C family)
MILVPGSPEEAGVSPTRVQNIYKQAKGWVEDGIHPALVILAARRGIVFLHEAFGRLGPEDNAPPLTRDTLFPLASITKPITAVAAMILLEEGLLGLNRPVVEYIPEFKGEHKDRVMIRHLMTHTSGLRDEDLEEQCRREGVEGDSALIDTWICENIKDATSLSFKTPLWKTPDLQMYYAGINYMLLTEVIQRVSGSSLARYTKENIFLPLGMTDTHLVVPNSAMEKVVRRPTSAYLHDVLRCWIEAPLGNAGAYSIVSDMAIFGQMFLNNGIYGETRILSPVSVQAMTKNQIPGISAQYVDGHFPEAGWSLGWSINLTYKGEAYGEPLLSPFAFAHSGSGGVQMWVDPAEDIIIIYFSVVLEMLGAYRKRWCADLFMNMVIAAIEDT